MGAAANIHANSTNSIQTAVESANPGDEIIVEPGTYTENIIIDKDDLVIRSSEGPAKTVIEADNQNLHVITIENSKNITINGFNIIEAGTNNSGVYLLGSTDCTIEENTFSNNFLGVYLETSNNNVIRNNAVSEQQNFGIYILNSEGNKLSGNTVNQNAVNGIVLENTNDTNLENNDVNSNANFGIYLSSSGSNDLRNNNVFNNTNGINLVFSSENTISNNTVSDNEIDLGTHAIFLNNSNDNDLQSNTISNCDYGIAMRYSNNNSLDNNNAYNNNRGIYLTRTSSINTLSNNQANSNTNSGIFLDENCNNNKIVSNTAILNTGTSFSSGIILGGADNNDIVNNNASRNNRGIYITSGASGNILSNNDVNSNAGRGIYLENADNNNLTSNTVSSNSNYGIYLFTSNDNDLFSNIVPGNSKGIYINASSENTVSNNTLSSNIGEGMMLMNSSSTILSRNTASNNSHGISLNSALSNEISSNTLTSNGKYGIYMCAKSSGNLIFDNYFDNSMNTNVRNATNVWNTTKTAGKSIAGGPYLGGNFWGKPDGSGYSQTTLDEDEDGIADELFSANNITDYLPLVAVYVPESVLPVANFTANVTSGYAPLSVQFIDLSENATGWVWDFDDGTNSTEQNSTHSYALAGTYNVSLTVSNPNGTDSKTVAINVLEEGGGGEDDMLPEANFSTNVTSGYYPLSVLFTDLSQNATSRSWDVNNDGIEDSNKTSFVYVYTSAGTYTAKLTATNENGTNIKTKTITVSRKSSGGSSSSGGGGGGGSPESSKNIEVKELAQAFITNGNAVKFDLTKNATCVVYVSFDAKKTVGKTTTTVEMLKEKSSLVSEPPSDEVYKFFNIWIGNSGYATSNNIENPVVCFKVEKAWVQDEKIDQASITLNRYSNETWEQLPVSLSEEDDTYLYFTSEVPGFSPFAITGKADDSEETVTEIQPDNESGDSEEEEDTGSEADLESEEEEEEESPGIPGFEVVYCVVGLLAAVFLYKRK